MNDLLKTLSAQLKEGGAGSKAVAALFAVAVAAILGVAAVVSNRPDFQLTFSGLSDHEVALVNKALSEAGIAFEVSQPPAPFVVFVDEADRSAAYRAVYGAGALDKPLKGILSDTGISSVFQGSEERMQGVRKREWEEMEGMLEVLDFVISARVRTSPRNDSVLAGSFGPPMGASVTLQVIENRLAKEQAETVANLVSRGLGVEKQHLVISDQLGNELYGGEKPDDESTQAKDLLAERMDYDREVTARANAVLDEILGPNKARVTVHSEWDYDKKTTHSETSTGKGSLLSEKKSSSQTPSLAGNAGPALGVSSNVATDAEAEDLAPQPAAEPPVATTSDEEKKYKPNVLLEERVRFVPTMTRMSVAVFLDESIGEDLAANLEDTIKAAVGFDDERDAFRSVRIPFVGAQEGTGEATGVEVAPGTGSEEEAPSGPSPMVELLLRRGVEIVTALVFVLLLVKSLKGSSASTEASQPREADQTAEIDPELLARAQVDELLQAEPERVTEILSSWARAEEPTTGART